LFNIGSDKINALLFGGCGGLVAPANSRN